MVGSKVNYKTIYRYDGRLYLAIEAYFQERPAVERETLAKQIEALTEIKGIGRSTAMEILWSLGRLMRNRRIKDD
jgi:3-methyladenine DNA glycosylase/8-oxoguanine DNA glycosylase